MNVRLIMFPLLATIAVFNFPSPALATPVPPAAPVIEPDAPVKAVIAPDAKLIIDQYIKATGGRAGWASLETLTGTGTVSIPAAEISGTAEVAISADYYRTTFRMSGGRVKDAVIISGRNGDVVWQLSGESDQYTGKVIEGVARLRNLRQYQFNQFLDLEKSFLRVELVDIEEIDGSMAVKLLMVPRESPGSIEYRYFDQSSHRIVRTVIEEPGMPVQESRYAAYKRVGPITMHTKTTRMAGGVELMVIFLPDLVADEPLPADIETMPLEIRVLLGEEKVVPPVPAKPKDGPAKFKELE